MNHAETELIEEQARRRALAGEAMKLVIQLTSQRILAVLVLLLDFAIFVWAITTESPMRLAGAVLFAAAAQLLVHWRPRQPGGSNET